MQNAEAAAAVGPDQDHCVLSFRYVAEGLLYVGGRGRLLTVHALNYVARLKSGILGRTSRLYTLDDGTLQVRRSLQLLAHVRGKVGDTDSPTRFAVVAAGGELFVLIFRAERFEPDRHIQVLTVAEDVERDLGSGTLGANFGLKFAGTGDFLPVEADDDVSDFETGVCPGRVSLHFADQGTVGILQIE